jgi:hypothetical protein
MKNGSLLSAPELLEILPAPAEPAIPCSSSPKKVIIQEKEGCLISQNILQK